MWLLRVVSTDGGGVSAAVDEVVVEVCPNIYIVELTRNTHTRTRTHTLTPRTHAQHRKKLRSTTLLGFVAFSF